MKAMTRRTFIASCSIASLIWCGSAGIESAQRLASQFAYQQLKGDVSTRAEEIHAPQSSSTNGPHDLLAQNSDAVGWLNVENTPVSYPLVQASAQRREWYLTHDFWSRRNVAGCPFIDDRCNVSSQHVLVFGHHLGSSDSMFSSLATAWKTRVFSNLGMASIELVNDAVYRFRPLCALHVEKDFEPIQRFEWPDDMGLHSWLGQILKEASATATDAQKRVEKTRQILTLATCSNAIAGQRERTLIVFVR